MRETSADLQRLHLLIDGSIERFAEIDSVQTEYAESPREWDGSAVYLLFKPDNLYTYAQDRDRDLLDSD